MTENVSRDLIRQLAQLSCIADQYQDELLRHCYLKNVPPGGVVLRKKEQELVQCYLIRGDIEVWHSFEDREYLHEDSVECRQPLNDLLFDADVIRAKSHCGILRVNNSALGRLMALSVENSTAAGDEYEEIFEESQPVATTNLYGRETGRSKQQKVDYFAKVMATIFNNQPVSARPAESRPATSSPLPSASRPLVPVRDRKENKKSREEKRDGRGPATSALTTDIRCAGVVTPLRIAGR